MRGSNELPGGVHVSTVSRRIGGKVGLSPWFHGVRRLNCRAVVN
jgi:hypothetical protein